MKCCPLWTDVVQQSEVVADPLPPPVSADKSDQAPLDLGKMGWRHFQVATYYGKLLWRMISRTTAPRGDSSGNIEV